MSLNTISTIDKIFLVGAVFLGIVSAVDFISHGQRAHDLLLSMGFSLVAYGMYRNGSPKWSDKKEYVPPDKAAHYGGLIGLLMILAAIAVRQFT